MKIIYRNAKREDAELLINLYNAAFYDDYMRYGECPGYGKTKEEMELSIENVPKYIIDYDGNPVGVLSYESKGNGIYYLGCLCLIPKYQGKGIGTDAIRYMKDTCKDWKRIELVTPADRSENISFYRDRCGFEIGEKLMDGKVELVNIFTYK
ncbi:MAG: GNAT family N-acetyltransferase [Clostridium butyricum]|nr:GNAT family N-acetyltransferase [Clostridium butyricum]